MEPFSRDLPVQAPHESRETFERKRMYDSCLRYWTSRQGNGKGRLSSSFVSSGAHLLCEERRLFFVFLPPHSIACTPL